MAILKCVAIAILYGFLVFIMLAVISVLPSAVGFIVTIFAIIVAVLSIRKHLINKKLPGGSKGAVLQGVWVLERHLKFDTIMKKYESLPVELKKNYFEFKGNQFRSGDFDENRKQLPAEWSFFSIERDNIIFESEFLKKGNWKWAIIKSGKLELTGETIHPEGKSQFVFYRKNWN